MNAGSYSRTPLTKNPASPFAREVYAERGVETNDGVIEEIAALRTELRAEVRALRSAIAKPKVDPASNELASEIAAMRAMLDELSAAAAPAPKRGDACAALVKKAGIEGPAATALARAAKAKPGDVRSPEQRVRDAIVESVRIAPWPIAHARTEKVMIALVGPAGVGKTTTAAKLGAHARRMKQSVAFVSCDAYRVGAVDQLRGYADLMESELHAITTPDELTEILASTEADVVIVDTSGRAPARDSVEASLGDDTLRDVARAHGFRMEVLLCTSAALRAADATRIVRDFAATRPTSICVTKLDETDAPSALVLAPHAMRLPLSTTCFGQRVPEDIATAFGDDVAARLVPIAAETAAAVEEG